MLYGDRSPLFTNTYLFSNTVRENLLLARPEASEDEMVAAARQAQIHASSNPYRKGTKPG